jgi:hypothetical protein
MTGFVSQIGIALENSILIEELLASFNTDFRVTKGV